MKAVWKYTLKPVVTLDIPMGAEILTIREQGEDICLWALVDPEAEKEPRRFLVVGTGHTVPDPDEGPEISLRYIGSAHLQRGSLVFHAFEVFSK
jgi:hypothetical protein